MADIELITAVAEDVAITVAHTWPYVVLGIITAAALKVYVGTDRLAALFRRRTGAAVGGSVAAAVATPFCSCGTTAVVLSMLTSAVPWAPIVAFMVASPLTSPDELLLSAGFFGWPFAWYFMAASVVLGFAGGAVALAAERGEFPAADRWRVREFVGEVLAVGPRMIALFLGFTIVGYTAVELIPTDWLTTLLGGSGPFAILFAATLGLPFYFSSEASMPLVASFVDGGMSEGAAMAFLITGAGTSIGAIAGALMIARWRAVAIVVGTLWVGAIVLGSIASLVL